MSSGRTELAAALKAGLTGWNILADQRALDGVTKPGACVLWTAKRTRFPGKGDGWFQDDLVLWVLTGTDKPDKIEDDLDQQLLQVVSILEPLNAYLWTEAVRGILEDRFTGWRIPITCLVHITEEP